MVLVRYLSLTRHFSCYSQDAAIISKWCATVRIRQLLHQFIEIPYHQSITGRLLLSCIAQLMILLLYSMVIELHYTHHPQTETPCLPSPGTRNWRNDANCDQALLVDKAQKNTTRRLLFHALGRRSSVVKHEIYFGL